MDYANDVSEVQSAAPAAIKKARRLKIIGVGTVIAAVFVVAGVIAPRALLDPAPTYSPRPGSTGEYLYGELPPPGSLAEAVHQNDVMADYLRSWTLGYQTRHVTDTSINYADECGPNHQ